MVWQIIRTDILLIALIFPRLTGLGKILRNTQISPCKKYSIGIDLSFSCDFIIPLITKFTQTWSLFTCGYENSMSKFFSVSTAKGDWGEHTSYFGTLSYDYKMIVSVCIIDQFCVYHGLNCSSLVFVAISHRQPCLHCL